MEAKRSSEATSENVPKKQRTTKVDIRILIPSKDAGAIFGRGGSNIKKLRNDHKTIIQVPDCDGPERLLIIGGEIEACLSTLSSIFPLLVDNYRAHSNICDVRILVHQSQAGAIIGRKGDRVKELRKKHGLEIKVFSECCPRSTERIIRITGRSANIITCLREILEALESAPPKGSMHHYDPYDFDELNADLYGGFGNPMAPPPPQLDLMNPDMMRRNLMDRDAFMADRERFFRDDYPMRNPMREERARALFDFRDLRRERERRNFDRDDFVDMRRRFPSHMNENPRGRMTVDDRFQDEPAMYSRNKSVSDYSGNNSRLRSSEPEFGHERDRYSGNMLSSISSEYRHGLADLRSGDFSAAPLGERMDRTMRRQSPFSARDSNRGAARGARDPPERLFRRSTTTTQVTLPDQFLAVIVGPRGSTLQEIKHKSGADIEIEDAVPGSSDCIITINGSHEEIQNAQYLLQMAVKQSGLWHS